MRTGNREIVLKDAHSKEINAVAFNPEKTFLLATGSSDTNVSLWDMRNLSSSSACPTHTMSGHKSEVIQLAWNNFNSAILASSACDRRVVVWDLDRIGAEQSEEDALDGPPELLFIHGGHTNRVPDVSWSAHMPWTVASVAEDNVCQVWAMAGEVYGEEDDEEGDDDMAVE